MVCVGSLSLYKNIRCYSKKTDNTVDYDNELDNSKPVKFSTSEAAKWKAVYSRKGDAEDDSPPSQPFIVSLSLAAFLLYFLVLRESNDIDIKLAGGTLNSTLANVEKVQLELLIEDDKLNNRPTDPKVLNRLKELEALLSAEA